MGTEYVKSAQAKKEPTCDHHEEYSAQSKPVKRKIMSHAISFSSFISLGTLLPSDLETFRSSRSPFSVPSNGSESTVYSMINLLTEGVASCFWIDLWVWVYQRCRGHMPKVVAWLVFWTVLAPVAIPWLAPAVRCTNFTLPGSDELSQLDTSLFRVPETQN